MYASTSSPAGNSIADAVAWIQESALGTVATTIAIVAVAAIGLLMLSGRLELRRGITVVLGCFILFGAAGIAATLTNIGGTGTRANQITASDSSPLAQQVRASPSSAPAAYDPYAGASVPTARQK
jgi:type IV secretory pathway VirB2 component (pilin)